jgi:hypothetical protein
MELLAEIASLLIYDCLFPYFFLMSFYLPLKLVRAPLLLINLFICACGFFFMTTLAQVSDRRRVLEIA